MLEYYIDNTPAALEFPPRIVDCGLWIVSISDSVRALAVRSAPGRALHHNMPSHNPSRVHLP